MIYEGTRDMGWAKHGLVQHPPYTSLAAWPRNSFLVHVRVAWKVESLNILDRRMLKCETLSGPQHAWLSKPLVGIKWQAGEIKFSEGSNCGWQKLFCKHITTFCEKWKPSWCWAAAGVCLCSSIKQRDGLNWGTMAGSGWSSRHQILTIWLWAVSGPAAAALPRGPPASIRRW